MDIERLKGATCPDCNGSGVYQECNEFDRYHVHACATCDGSGEIARQSVASEEVQEAIEQIQGTRRKAQKELDSLIEIKSRYDHQIEIGDLWNWKWEESWHPLAVEGHKQTIKNANLAITALQAYQPWIPVSERLPDGDVASVLIYTKEGGVAEGQYYPSIRAWKQFRWSVEDSSVTHWKPLPEPPKGG